MSTQGKRVATEEAEVQTRVQGSGKGEIAASKAFLPIQATSPVKMRKHGHGPGHPLRLAANAGTAMPQDAKAEPMMPTKAKMICVGPAGSIGVEWTPTEEWVECGGAEQIAS
jgi:hypothetical protein